MLYTHLTAHNTRSALGIPLVYIGVLLYRTHAGALVRANNTRSALGIPCTQVPWYAVLGNHDYGELSDAKLLRSCAASTFDACPAGCCYSAAWQTNLSSTDWRWNAKQVGPVSSYACLYVVSEW